MLLKVCMAYAFCWLAVECSAARSSEPALIWADRLEALLRERYSASGIKQGDSVAPVELAIYPLAWAGFDERAIEISCELFEDPFRAHSLCCVADVQSTCGDLSAALRTVERIGPPEIKQRAIELVAIRQAQNGSFKNAIQVAEKLGDTKKRNGVLRFVVDEALERFDYSTALEHYIAITEEETKERARVSLERHLRLPRIDEPDFVEKMVDYERSWRSRFFGFSESDEKLLRFRCKAQLTAHQGEIAKFRAIIEQGRNESEGESVSDRCVFLFRLGAHCCELGQKDLAKQLFDDALGDLFAEGKVKYGSPQMTIYFAIGVNEYLTSVAEIMSDSELEQIAMKFLVNDESNSGLSALARGIIRHGRWELADSIYAEIQDSNAKQRFAEGVLAGVRPLDGPANQNHARSRPTELTAMQARALSALERIVEEKQDPTIVNTNSRRPKREFMGYYNVNEKQSGQSKNVWRESDNLPGLVLDEFWSVRAAVSTALWGHGSVNVLNPFGGTPDFFIWDDKWFDRTQKIEINTTKYLVDNLPGAVAAIQEALAEHPTWRVMMLGHGKTANQQFFVIYPDAIRIYQANQAGDLTQAIKANAKLRLGDAETSSSSEAAAGSADTGVDH